jgi:hypothetical protein
VLQPSSLDGRIGTLCSLALHSSAARDWLGEQFETLHELQQHLDGVHLLQGILTAQPDPESPAAINRFLNDLPEPDRLALFADPSFAEGLPEDPVTVAAETLADASGLALEKEDARIKAALNDPDLPSDEAGRLLARMKEIAELLTALPGRALTNDQFTPKASRRNRANASWKKDFPEKRKP